MHGPTVACRQDNPLLNGTSTDPRRRRLDNLRLATAKRCDCRSCDAKTLTFVGKCGDRKRGTRVRMPPLPLPSSTAPTAASHACRNSASRESAADATRQPIETAATLLRFLVGERRRKTQRVLRLRRATNPTTPNPNPISAKVDGSGTTDTTLTLSRKSP